MGRQEDQATPAGEPGDAAAAGGAPTAPSSPSAAPTGEPPPLSRARRLWVRALLVLATVLAILAIFALWANRQLMSPTHWANTSTALLQKQTIRQAVAGFLVDQLYAHVDVAAKLRSGLPSELRPLADPASGALHGVAEDAAQRVLAIPRVQSLWRTANRTADEELVTIINGGTRQVQIQGGTVLLNLHQIVTDLSRRLGLDPGLVEKLPPSFAQVKIVSSKELGIVRSLAKGLHALSIILTGLVIALYGLALLLAAGRRRRTLMWIGLSLVSAGVIVLVARAIARGQIVSAVTKDASIEPAARDAYTVATSLLVQVATSSIIIGLPLIFASWVAGPARAAEALRRFLAPRLRARPRLLFWVTGAILALIFIWGPIEATRKPFAMLLFTVLGLVGAHVLSGQIASEFPGVEARSLGTALRDYTQALGERAARVSSAIAGAAGGGSAPSRAAEIEHLLALRERGALSEVEFEAAKRDVLAGH
jgi:hypothetical protein